MHGSGTLLRVRACYILLLLFSRANHIQRRKTINAYISTGERNKALECHRMLIILEKKRFPVTPVSVDRVLNLHKNFPGTMKRQLNPWEKSNKIPNIA